MRKLQFIVFFLLVPMFYFAIDWLANDQIGKWLCSQYIVCNK